MGGPFPKSAGPDTLDARAARGSLEERLSSERPPRAEEPQTVPPSANTHITMRVCVSVCAHPHRQPQFRGVSKAALAQETGVRPGKACRHSGARRRFPTAPPPPPHRSSPAPGAAARAGRAKDLRDGKSGPANWAGLALLGDDAAGLRGGGAGDWGAAGGGSWTRRSERAGVGRRGVGGRRPRQGGCCSRRVSVYDKPALTLQLRVLQGQAAPPGSGAARGSLGARAGGGCQGPASVCESPTQHSPRCPPRGRAGRALPQPWGRSASWAGRGRGS